MTAADTLLKAKGLEVLKGFFSAEITAELKARGQEVIEGVAAGRYTRDGQFANGVASDWLGDFVRASGLIEPIQKHLGPDVCLFSWRVLMKDRHFNGEVLIHQDWPYYGGGLLNKLNVFVPLTRVHRGNGAIVFYEESHDFGPLERGAIDAARYPDLVESCPELEVGDVLLADFLTWHYSVPATVDEDRIMMQLIFQPADDPSSKNLITGEIRNRRWLPDRFEAMAAPSSYVNTSTARYFFEAGDHARAEKFARGVLSTNLNDAEAALILHDVLKARGDAEADMWLGIAREAAAKVAAAMAAHEPAGEAAPEAPPEPVSPPPWTAGRVVRGLARRLKVG